MTNGKYFVRLVNSSIDSLFKIISLIKNIFP